FESTVAAISKQPGSRATIRFWRAVGFVLRIQAAKHVLLGRPLHVIAHEQVQKTVAIVVEPQGGCAEPGPASKPAALGHIGKRSFAGVLKQAALANAGNEKVGEPVIVE